MRCALFACLCAAVTATPALAIDDCLNGPWVADVSDLAQAMGAQMNGQATLVGGSVTMQITPDGVADMTVNNLTFNVKVPDVPAMDVSINGVSRGQLTAAEGRWSVVSIDYSLVGSANVMGQTMTIPFSSDTGMLGSGSGDYTCSASEATFESDSPDARMPPRWTRGG